MKQQEEIRDNIEKTFSQLDSLRSAINNSDGFSFIFISSEMIVGTDEHQLGINMEGSYKDQLKMLCAAIEKEPVLGVLIIAAIEMLPSMQQAFLAFNARALLIHLHKEDENLTNAAIKKALGID